MKNKSEIDALPESFATEEEAGEFWDTHSTMDYLDYLEPSNDVIAIEQRVFEVRVAEDVFEGLQQRAKLLHEPLQLVVDKLLRERLRIQNVESS